MDRSFPSFARYSSIFVRAADEFMGYQGCSCLQYCCLKIPNELIHHLHQNCLHAVQRSFWASFQAIARVDSHEMKACFQHLQVTTLSWRSRSFNFPWQRRARRNRQSLKRSYILETNCSPILFSSKHLPHLALHIFCLGIRKTLSESADSSSVFRPSSLLHLHFSSPFHRLASLHEMEDLPLN